MITVFTIVYNDYGRFIPQWLEWLRQQTLKPELLVVLGKDHGADIKWLKENKIKYVICDSDNMGVLRNAGLEKVKTDWWLYFSVDDELLPHACEEIVNTDADAISIRFDVIEPDGSIKKDCHSPHITTVKELNNWSRCWGGYVAVKGNTNIRFREDIEVPNLTLHFELFKRDLKVVKSETILAIHHRWGESHHFRSKNIRKKFVIEIDKTKEEIIEELIKGGNYMMTIKALQNYTDEQLKKEKENKTLVLRNGEKIEVEKGKILKNDEYCVEIDRGNQIINAGYAKMIDLEKIGKKQPKIEDTEIKETILADGIVITEIKSNKKRNKKTSKK